MERVAVRKQAISSLLSHSKTKGYITFDDILNTSQYHNLSIDEVDRVSQALLTQGVIVHDEEPTQTILIDHDDGIEYDDYGRVDYDAVFTHVIEMNPSLDYLIEQIRLIPPPQYREIQTLIHQAQDGNTHARNRIISMYLRVAIRIALNSAKRLHIDVADTISTGVIGLIYALDKFDPNGSYLFPQYAPFWIQQSINREAPGINPNMYFPIHVKEKLFSIYGVCEDHFCPCCQPHYICPNLCNEVMEKLSTNYDEAYKLISYMYSDLALDHIQETDEELFSDNGQFEYVMNENIDEQMLRDLINANLQTLKEREAQVIINRFGLQGTEEKTLEEIGQIFGVTRERIRQIEAKSIRKLRQPTRSRALKRYY